MGRDDKELRGRELIWAEAAWDVGLTFALTRGAPDGASAGTPRAFHVEAVGLHSGLVHRSERTWTPWGAGQMVDRVVEGRERADRAREALYEHMARRRREWRGPRA